MENSQFQTTIFDKRKLICQRFIRLIFFLVFCSFLNFVQPNYNFKKCRVDSDCGLNQVCSTYGFTDGKFCFCKNGYELINDICSIIKTEFAHQFGTSRQADLPVFPCSDASTCNLDKWTFECNGGVCACKGGYKLNSENDRCIKEFDCDNDDIICQLNAVCEDKSTIKSCYCGDKHKFQEKASHPKCILINECDKIANFDLCQVGSECTDIEGDYGCTCQSSKSILYNDDSFICVDEDINHQCSSEMNKCLKPSDCYNDGNNVSTCGCSSDLILYKIPNIEQYICSENDINICPKGDDVCGDDCQCRKSTEEHRSSCGCPLGSRVDPLYPVRCKKEFEICIFFTNCKQKDRCHYVDNSYECSSKIPKYGKNADMIVIIGEIDCDEDDAFDCTCGDGYTMLSSGSHIICYPSGDTQNHGCNDQNVCIQNSKCYESKKAPTSSVCLSPENMTLFESKVSSESAYIPLLKKRCGEIENLTSEATCWQSGDISYLTFGLGYITEYKQVYNKKMIYSNLLLAIFKFVNI